MADTNEPIIDRQQYVNDPRIACIYGAKCYQKNPVHQQKYKHPPPKRPNQNATTQPNKKIKLDDSDNSSVTNSEVSDDEIKTKDNQQKRVDKQTKEETDRDNLNVSHEVSPKQNDTKNEAISEKPYSISDVTNLGRTKKDFCPKTFIKEKFLVEMPEDFYSFWDFCKSLKEKCPQEALKDVGLTLVGPYDVLAGKFYDIPEQPDDNYLCHWRYYYDPPECQTVLKGDDKTGYHIGYFRDSPKDLPVFLVNNFAKSDGIFKVMGDNIFAAVYLYLEDLKKTGDPFKKMHVGRFQNALKKRAEDLRLSLSEKTQQIRDRDKNIVSRSFSKIGIVVPYNRKSQLGYRDLGVTNKELLKILNDIQGALPEQRQKHLSKLQDILTNVSIATDECDFGTGIELGLDILAHGVNCLNQTVSRFLATNYRLIDRDGFAKIAEAHMKNRKRGTNLSII